MATALARPDLKPGALLPLIGDRRLVEQVEGGSEQAFEALVDRHRGPLLEFCRRMLGSRDDAEDIVQQTFLVAWGEITRAESPRSLRPWLYGIARHRCLTLLRARRVRSVADAPEIAIDHVADEVAMRDDLRALLTDLARLPGDQRAALVLAELGDVSYEEIARLLGCSREKVKALRYQARCSLEAGRLARETPCAEIREQLATLRGGGLRRALLRRHLRDCAGCRTFRDELRARRRRFGLVPPIFPLVALKRVVFGAASGSGGHGAGAAAVSAGSLSGAGLAATALVTAAIPIGGIAAIGGVAAAVLAHGHDRAASRTFAPAGAAAWSTYGAAPAQARAGAPASDRSQQGSSAKDGVRDGAGNRPRRAREIDTPASPAVVENGSGPEDVQTTAPGHDTPDTPSHSAKPPGFVAPPGANGGATNDTPTTNSPAPSGPLPRPESRGPKPPTGEGHRPPATPTGPSARPAPRGDPRPGRPATPTAPAEPNPPPRSPPQQSRPEPPTPPEPSERPAPTTGATPSPGPAESPGGRPGGDGRNERGTPR
jgi:RNA polymerase sigma factor (sigma-70 family)